MNEAAAYDLPERPISLEELTGYQVDPAAYLASVRPHMERRQLDLRAFAHQAMIRNSDVMAKVTKWDWRTPVSPHLGEISRRLGEAVYFNPWATDEKIAELLAYYDKEVREAREHFYDD